MMELYYAGEQKVFSQISRPDAPPAGLGPRHGRARLD